MARKVLVIFVSIVVLWVVFISPIAAQDKTVNVQLRDAEITILPNGDVKVVETWDVDFNGGPFHFAFRTIPLNKVDGITDWGMKEGNQVYELEPMSGGAPGTFTTSSGDDGETIRWYFEPTSDSSRTFELSYTLKQPVFIHSEGDEFYWIFIESDRGYPIQKSNVVVHLPEDFPKDQIKAVAYLNRKEDTAGMILDDRTVQFEGGPFEAGDTWEIKVTVPHGVLAATPPAWQLKDQRQASLGLIVNIIAISFDLIVIAAAAYFVRQVRRAKRLAHAGLQPSAMMPVAIPPASASRLVRNETDERDMVATLIDLARRDYLRMSGSGVDLKFAPVRPADDTMRPFERQLLSKMFKEQDPVDKNEWLPQLKRSVGSFQT